VKKAPEIRESFTKFFVDNGHTAVPSLPLIPYHPAAPLFTNAGMVQFFPYFLGEEQPPYSRATSIQKCVRIKGAHDDIKFIGRTTRHLTFFEMLGNFSFGDYFKEEAIKFAWDLSVNKWKLDGDRIWPTIYEEDDEAFEIWRDVIGLPENRIQRMGMADNYWAAGETGPCGPCSELHYDRGSKYGADGGPRDGDADRFVEYWNLVFMQYERNEKGKLNDLPKKNIDTGAGLERVAMLLQDTPSLFETDLFMPLIKKTASASKTKYGEEYEHDVTLRIIADHARSSTFLITDGVVPSNEERGYVLRRIMRRAIRHAYQLGVESLILSELAKTVAEIMSSVYPEIEKNLDATVAIIDREETRFRQTLKQGSQMLDDELNQGGKKISGSVAFKLHDTFGFPIELTKEIAEERKVDVDEKGFEKEMEKQRARGKASTKAHAAAASNDSYRELLEQYGTTEFTGYVEYETNARVLAILEGENGTLEVFLDRTPFYAERGGQIGDTGTITSSSGTLRVLDTTSALPGLTRHVVQPEEGIVDLGQDVVAKIDAERREAIRRNHTGTHLLHWALRKALGDHVKQSGSLVAPDRLRFDYSHFEALTPDQIREVEDLVNNEVLASLPVRAYETTMDEAQARGAIMFFGEKYGDIVRVVEAGTESIELCGGTHTHDTGMVGPLKIVSETSIGANMRRIEAVTGFGTVERLNHDEAVLEKAADALRASSDEVPDALERLISQKKDLEDELDALRGQMALYTAKSLLETQQDGAVVARIDGLSSDLLRSIALNLRDAGKLRAVVLGGSPDGAKVSLVSAVSKESKLNAGELLAEAAKIVGGGAGKSPELAVAGGKNPAAIDDALAAARKTLAK
jgi:alanyl-tRNA synthetase